MKYDKTAIWMIYGAYGFTGELIAREAVNQGLKPILAGRSEAKLAPLADELNLEKRIFDLDDLSVIVEQLQDVAIVLHCAGPFSATAPPMIEACLTAGTHYLDITGEIAVFEHVFAQHRRAQEAEVILCPGVGFDVIPTDCVAAHLAEALPDATHLTLAFVTRGGPSPGTTKTVIEGLAENSKVRQGGKIISVPMAHKKRAIDFGEGERPAVTLPWGDIATAWYTTSIPNIEVYTAWPEVVKSIKWIKRLGPLRPLFGLKLIQTFLKNQIEKKVHGPDAADREQMPAYVWGEAINAKGDKRVARIRTANGYTVTFYGALEVVKHLQAYEFKGGAYTPSKLVGKDLIKRLPGSGALLLEAA